MDSIKAYEDLKAKAEAARLKAVEELEVKKKALLGQIAEIDGQLESLGARQASDSALSKAKGSGKGAMTEEKRKKLSEAATKRWEEKKKQTA